MLFKIEHFDVLKNNFILANKGEYISIFLKELKDGIFDSLKKYFNKSINSE